MSGLLGLFTSSRRKNESKLREACSTGDYMTVDRLLTNEDISVNCHDAEKKTPLILSVLNGHTAVVGRVLTITNVSLNHKDKSGTPAFIWACSKGHLDIVVKFTEICTTKKLDLNAHNPSGWTGLHMAAANGYNDIVMHLLLQCHPKVKVNAVTKYGWSALHVACLNGHRAVVKSLLNDARVVLDHADSEGWKPADLARRSNHFDIAEMVEDTIETRKCMGVPRFFKLLGGFVFRGQKKKPKPKPSSTNNIVGDNSSVGADLPSSTSDIEIPNNIPTRTEAEMHIVSSALVLGFSQDAVRHVIEKSVASNQEPYHDLNKFIDNLNNFEQFSCDHSVQGAASLVLPSAPAEEIIPEVRSRPKPQRPPPPRSSFSAIDKSLSADCQAASADSQAKSADYQAASSTGGIDESKECKICMEMPITQVFDPCGHIVACESCAKQQTICPICRQTINKCLKVFYP